MPQWMESFECNRVKENTSLSDRQVIAGREQARTAQILTMSLSGRLHWFQKEIQAQTQQGTKPSISQALRMVYLKTGCTETVEGTTVCALLSQGTCASVQCGIVHVSYSSLPWVVYFHIYLVPVFMSMVGTGVLCVYPCPTWLIPATSFHSTPT